ncbi:MAG: META domain-containing protein [Cytophagales bacterium]|nr:MAG: META domain-containing protein [Cytophagales bacterium]
MNNRIPSTIINNRLLCACLIALLTFAGCQRKNLTANTVTRKSVAKTGKLTEATDWADKRRQGVDFIAVGTGPVATTTGNWRLDIDFSKQMLFQTLNGPELLLPMPKPQPTGKGMGVLLDSRAAPMYASTSRRSPNSRASVARNRLIVSIEPVSCRDPLTRRDYAYTVRIDANGKRYVGCGAFIKGSDRLNGTWSLETFKGQRLRPDQFANSELPFLEIDLNEGKLSGSTGWNKIKGDITAEGDHLTIDPKTTTHKPANGKFEAEFLDALRQSSLFRIGKDRLTLLVNGQYAMTLVKK